jgi:hypothetical protein
MKVKIRTENILHRIRLGAAIEVIKQKNLFEEMTKEMKEARTDKIGIVKKYMILANILVDHRHRMYEFRNK